MTETANKTNIMPFILIGGVAVGAYLLYKKFSEPKKEESSLQGDYGSIGAGNLSGDQNSGVTAADDSTQQSELQSYVSSQMAFNQGVMNELRNNQIFSSAYRQQQDIQAQLNKVAYSMENSPNKTVMPYDTAIDMGQTLQYGQYVPVSERTKGILQSYNGVTRVDPAFLNAQNAIDNNPGAILRDVAGLQKPLPQSKANIKDVTPDKSTNKVAMSPTGSQIFQRPMSIGQVNSPKVNKPSPTSNVKHSTRTASSVLNAAKRGSQK